MARFPLLPLLFALCLTACQTIVDHVADDIADQVSEQVNEQLDAAVARQVGTAVTGMAPASSPEPAPVGEVGRVTRVIDGDTIDVLIDGKNTRIRYLQMNTPERDEPCYREATVRNADLVAGKTVTLVSDVELVDRFDRWLRFVYVGDVSVSRVLVEEGFAEVVLYPPNRARYDEFARLEAAAAAAGRGCHPTGIFADGSSTR